MILLKIDLRSKLNGKFEFENSMDLELAAGRR